MRWVAQICFEQCHIVGEISYLARDLCNLQCIPKPEIRPTSGLVAQSHKSDAHGAMLAGQTSLHTGVLVFVSGKNWISTSFFQLSIFGKSREKPRSAGFGRKTDANSRNKWEIFALFLKRKREKKCCRCGNGRPDNLSQQTHCCTRSLPSPAATGRIPVQTGSPCQRPKQGPTGQRRRQGGRGGGRQLGLTAEGQNGERGSRAL